MWNSAVCSLSQENYKLQMKKEVSDFSTHSGTNNLFSVEQRRQRRLIPF